MMPWVLSKGADITVILTEWNEFRAILPDRMAATMAGDIIVDLRNIYDPVAMASHQLKLFNIGRMNIKGSDIQS